MELLHDDINSFLFNYENYVRPELLEILVNQDCVGLINFLKGYKAPDSYQQWENADEMGYTLCISAFYGWLDGIKILVAAGVEPECAHNLPMKEACRKGHEGIVKYFLDLGCNADSYFKHYEVSPLEYAVMRNHYEIARILLMYNADPFDWHLGCSDPDEGDTTVCLWDYAFCNDDIKMMELLISYGLSDDKVSKRFCSFVSLAAVCNSQKLLRYFLDLDYDVEGPGNFYRMTPLMGAAKAGKLEVVNILLEYGADPKRKDRWEDTAVDYAKAGMYNTDFYNHTVIDKEPLIKIIEILNGTS
jgi:ankyrin repeat protein